MADAKKDVEEQEKEEVRVVIERNKEIRNARVNLAKAIQDAEEKKRQLKKLS